MIFRLFVARTQAGQPCFKRNSLRTRQQIKGKGCDFCELTFSSRLQRRLRGPGTNTSFKRNKTYSRKTLQMSALCKKATLKATNFPPTAAARIALPPAPVIAHNLQLPQNIFCCVSCSSCLILHLVKLFSEAVSALTQRMALLKECPSLWKLTFHQESRCSVGNFLRGPTALRPRY